MTAPESFLPSHGPDGFTDAGPWAGRGRRVQDPDTGRAHVALPAPSSWHPGQDPGAQAAGVTVSVDWDRVASRGRTVRSDRVALPQAVVREDDRIWLLYDDVVEQSFAQDVARLGGAVQDQVLGMVADVAEAIGVLHDHGLTLRRMSLRDVLATESGWLVLVAPDSGIREMRPGRESRDAQGDLAMVATAAATVLTGRRPSPGRQRPRLSVTCPGLPQRALDLIDQLLDDVPGERADQDHPPVSTDPAGGANGAVVADHAGGEVLGDRAREVAAVIRDSLDGRSPEEPTGEDTETLPRTATGVSRDSTEDVLDLLRSGRTPARRQSVRRRADQVRSAARPWDPSELMVEEDPEPVGHPSRSARFRRPWVAALAVIVAVVLVGVGAQALRSRDGETGPESGTESGSVVAEPAVSPSPSASPSAAATSAASPGEALPGLVAARGQALRAGDPELLTDIYVDGAADLTADRSTVEGLQIDPETGEHAFSRLSMAVLGDPVVTTESDDAASVDVTVAAEGLGPDQANSQDISVSMVRTGDGWRIQDVQPR